MKKVLLQTANYPGVGGIERSFEILSNRFASKGYDVKIVAVASEENKNFKDVVTYETKKYRFLKIGPLINFLAYRDFIKLNREIFDDAILISRLLPVSFALHVMKIKHIFIPPAVSKDFYEGIARNINNSNLIFRMLKKVQNSFAKNIAIYFEKQVLKDESVKVVTFSENVKNNLLLSSGVQRDIKVIPAGIDITHFFSLEQNEIDNLLVSQNINKDDFVVMYAGRLSRGKNVHLLVHTFNALDIKNKKLLIVGSGDFEIPSGENIISVGKKTIKELHQFYNMSNCLVLPTTHEGFGQVLVESLGCGTPVVGFDTSTTAINEIIDDMVFGEKTDDVSQEGLKIAIMKLYENRKFYQEHRKLIESRAKEKFNWENLVEECLGE